MALQEWAGSLKFTYQVVTVDKSSPLGTGAYGAVYRAKCDDLDCAAKVIHDMLLIGNLTNYQGQGEGRILENFYRECHFLSELKHPNIVQYLGTRQEENSGRTELILLMEMMKESLTHYLENSTVPLPLFLEVSIANDIALALSYLHSNRIVHRDLTGNNVLLDAGQRAKVTDFGVSKLIDPEALQRSSLSLHPGTAAYMPPEAVEEVQSPHYSEKLDCFSYGVLCIQIFTREFPKPSSRYISIDSEEASQVNIRAVVSERVRRENHISMVQHDHILLPTVSECLNDNPRDRPSSQELCHRLVLLKENPAYIESKASNTHRSAALSDDHQRDRNTIRRLERELSTCRSHNDRLQEELDSLSGSHRQEITRKNNEIQALNSRIASAEQQRYQKEQECEQKEVELNRAKTSLEQLQSDVSLLEESLRVRDRTIEDLESQKQMLREELVMKTSLLNELQSKKESIVKMKLKWRNGPDACTKLRREPDAVLDGNTIYFKYFWGISIYAYNTEHQSWVDYPSCPVSSFSMAVLDGLLTIIGGKSTDLAPVSTLHSYSGKKWVQKFPSMKTERYWTMSCTCESHLIVMGGEGKDRRVLNTVEVLDLQTYQWSFASSLPRPMDSAASAICGDHLYVGGGSHPDTARYIAVCSLPQLLEDLQKEPVSIRASLSRQRIWNQIEDLPYLKTSLTSISVHLFAVGGKDDTNQPTAAVYVYNALGKNWQKISEMSYARSSCYAVGLSNDEILVVGGINENIDIGRLVEIGSLVQL